MDVQIIIATMHRKLEEIEELKAALNLENQNVLFVNQCSTDTELIQLNKKTSLICSTQRGISKSRNLGLMNASGEIVLIADDDLIYLDGFENKVIEAFRKHSEASVICFKSNKKNMFLKDKTEELNKISMSSVYSVQIAFRKSDLLKHEIRFNEWFGTGSGVFSSGEENILIDQCLRKGLKCLYVPEEILYVPDSLSSWFHGFDEAYFFSKGALLYKLYGKMSFIMIAAFAFLKGRHARSELSFCQMIRTMNAGKRRLIELESRENV